MIRSLALEKGYDGAISIIEDDIYNLYMDGTVFAKIELLEEMIERILEPLSE